MAKASIHKGHRERLKERFLTEGLDNFTDTQALNCFCFTPFPKRIPIPSPMSCWPTSAVCPGYWKRRWRN